MVSEVWYEIPRELLLVTSGHCRPGMGISQTKIQKQQITNYKKQYTDSDSI